MQYYSIYCVCEILHAVLQSIEIDVRILSAVYLINYCDEYLIHRMSSVVHC